jgi:flagellar hook protein FlgE
MKIECTTSQVRKRNAMISTIRNALQISGAEISLITNNIANAGTTGFKGSRASFLDTYAEEVPRKGLNVGFGAMQEEARRSHSKQGEMRVTNSSLDVAVNGLGMFVTTSPQEGDVTFTRDGSFKIDINGNLETSEGRAVVNSEGIPIVIPPSVADANGNISLLSSLEMDEGGKIQASYGDGSLLEIGSIGLARFGNVSGLKAVGNGHFVMNENSGPPIIGAPMTQSFGQVMIGHLEVSNVNMTDELTKLMKAQQAFSGASRMLQSATELTRKLTT